MCTVSCAEGIAGILERITQSLPLFLGIVDAIVANLILVQLDPSGCAGCRKAGLIVAIIVDQILNGAVGTGYIRDWNGPAVAKGRKRTRD